MLEPGQPMNCMGVAISAQAKWFDAGGNELRSPKFHLLQYGSAKQAIRITEALERLEMIAAVQHDE